MTITTNGEQPAATAAKTQDSVNIDDLIAAVVSGIPVGDEGSTAQEIADRHGKSKDWARKWLRRAVRAGAVSVGKGYRTDTAGRVQSVPVYRGVQDGRAGSGRRAESGSSGQRGEGRTRPPL